jgi:hypothetical protein
MSILSMVRLRSRLVATTAPYAWGGFSLSAREAHS